MEHLRFIYAHFGQSVVFLSWIVAGVVAIARRDPDPLWIPFWVTVGYCIVKGY